MRVSLNELMDILGVGYVPGAYESVPWSHYEPEEGITCAAEIRMGMDGDELEGEIQLLFDQPPEGGASMQHVCYLKIKQLNDGFWAPVELRLLGAPMVEEIYDWESKACDFFRAVVEELLAGSLPDIESLIDEFFHSRERFGDKNGGGSKSPKIRPNQVLGMKTGRGF